MGEKISVIEERLKAIIYEVLEEKSLMDKFDAEAPFIDLGINSVKFVKIIVALETEFDIEFNGPELNYRNYKTWNNLIQSILEKREVVTAK